MAVKSRKRSASERRPSRRESPRPRPGSTRDAPRQRESLRALQQTVEDIGRRLHRDRLLQIGAIVFRVADGDGPSFALRATENGVQVESGGDYTDVRLEVMGDPRRIESIVRGRKDARMQFFAGGIRVRGDMHYLSQLGMELGFLKTPIV